MNQHDEWSELCPCEREAAEDLQEARGLTPEEAASLAYLVVERHCAACPRLLPNSADEREGWMM